MSSWVPADLIQYANVAEMDVSMDEGEHEQEDTIQIFGIEVPNMNPDVHPLDCLILIKGINLSNGGPTMTSIGSENLTTWEAMGMLQMEIERLKAFILFNDIQSTSDDEN